MQALADSASSQRTETSLATSEDIVTCYNVLKAGSKSFAAASLLLPKHVRAPSAAIYAFCRIADDAVDEAQDPAVGLAHMHRRLENAYTNHPYDDPIDRAFAAVVSKHHIPQSIPLALLEGFAWDVENRRYANIDELEAYCARVASTVGVMMTLLMGSRDRHVLARACDLGLAMQLTNIARDVGEDARAGRLYLPLEWLHEAGIDVEPWMRKPEMSPALAAVIKRLLTRADVYYRRADDGISMLPRSCRVAIRAARLIYADIGRRIAVNNYDSINKRAFTSAARKLFLLARALLSPFWRRHSDISPPRPAVAFLIDSIDDLAKEATHESR